MGNVTGMQWKDTGCVENVKIPKREIKQPSEAVMVALEKEKAALRRNDMKAYIEERILRIRLQKQEID